MVKIWKLTSQVEDTNLNLQGETNSLDNGSQELPAGVYSTFRTFHHDRVLRLQDHFDRLVTSAELQDVHFRFEQKKVRQGLREIISEFPEVDVRLRIHWSLNKSEPVVYLMGELFNSVPEEFYIHGVSVKTIQLSRNNPLSKATSFINETRELRAAKPADIHEYLLIGNDGQILEGMTSNVLCILNGTIYTASTGILNGITRQLVLEAVGSLSVPVVQQGLSVKDLSNVDEACITSASRGVLPVTLVDGKKVGSGKPGPLTQKIMFAYLKKLEAELEPI